MTWRSNLVAGSVAGLPLLAPQNQPASIAILNVSIVPMDRDRVLTRQTGAVTFFLGR